MKILPMKRGLPKKIKPFPEIERGDDERPGIPENEEIPEPGKQTDFHLDKTQQRGCRGECSSVYMRRKRRNEDEKTCKRSFSSYSLHLHGAVPCILR